MTSTKAFEDRANNILSEIRKQRRSLHLEYNVGKVTFVILYSDLVWWIQLIVILMLICVKYSLNFAKPNLSMVCICISEILAFKTGFAVQNNPLFFWVLVVTLQRLFCSRKTIGIKCLFSSFLICKQFWTLNWIFCLYFTIS